MERHYGWVIVAIGALMGCVGMGSMFSLAAERVAAGDLGRRGTIRPQSTPAAFPTR